MPRISELIKAGRYRIVRMNPQKRYLVLAIEGYPECRIYVHFDLIPTEALFQLTAGTKDFPADPTTCNENNGGRYGRIHM